MSEFSRGFTLTHKLALLGSALVAGTGITVAAVYYAYARGMVYDELRVRGEILGANLAENAKGGIEHENAFGSLDTLVEVVSRRRDVVYAAVYGLGDRPLVSSRPEALAGDVLDIRRGVYSNSELLQEDAISGTQNRLIGSVHIQLSKTSFQERMARAFYFGCAVVVLIAALASMAGASLAEKIAEPIAGLSKAAVKIGRGEYGISVPEPPGEIGDLARAFNAMSLDLAKTKGYLEEVLDAMLDVMVIVGADGNIRSMNRAALELLEYGPSELIGQPISKLFSTIDRNPFEGDHMQFLLRQGAIREIFTSWLTKFGESIDLRFSASLLKEKSGRPFAILILAHPLADPERPDA